MYRFENVRPIGSSRNDLKEEACGGWRGYDNGARPGAWDYVSIALATTAVFAFMFVGPAVFR
jgi:hypothetical protein